MRLAAQIAVCVAAMISSGSHTAGHGLPMAMPQEVGMSAEGLARIDTAVQKFIRHTHQRKTQVS